MKRMCAAPPEELSIDNAFLQLSRYLCLSFTFLQSHATTFCLFNRHARPTVHGLCRIILLTGTRYCPIYNALANLHEAYFEGEWSANCNDLSIRTFHQWDNLDEGPQTKEYVMNQFGYKAILDHFISKIPSDCIKYKSRVMLIDYSGKGVTLQLQSGIRTKTFDSVIVTVPLGHLKRYSRSMFKPKLPRHKQEAIDKLGFGAAGKLMLIYDEPFWPKQIHSFVTLPVNNCSESEYALPTDSLS